MTRFIGRTLNLNEASCNRNFEIFISTVSDELLEWDGKSKYHLKKHQNMSLEGGKGDSLVIRKRLGI